MRRRNTDEAVEVSDEGMRYSRPGEKGRSANSAALEACLVVVPLGH